MRKCIDLESQPGFQSIYAPQMQQAIDRGLAGHSGTGVVDWGYADLGITTRPTRKPDRGEPIPEKLPPDHYNVVNPVRLGRGEYWDYLFNTFATPEFRLVANKFPAPQIKVNNEGGYFDPNTRGTYGTIYTPKGSDTDITTFFHEYGHYLDNVIGFKIQGLDNNTWQNYSQILKASEGFVDAMIADGKALGLVLDNSAYWKYLFDNGLDTTFKGNKTFKISKGLNEEEISQKMQGGDFWRVMEEILTRSKKDVADIKNTKNPDPVKLKRAEEIYANITNLYDQHLNSVKIAKEISAKVFSTKLGTVKQGRELDGGIWRHPSAIGDIIEALTSGDLTDYEIATGDYFMMGRHGPGYYSTRLYREKGKWITRNHNMQVAENFKRYEIFAQLTQFMAHQDNTAMDIMKELMPNLVKSYEKIIKDAQITV